MWLQSKLDKLLKTEMLTFLKLLDEVKDVGLSHFLAPLLRVSRNDSLLLDCHSCFDPKTAFQNEVNTVAVRISNIIDDLIRRVTLDIKQAGDILRNVKRHGFDPGDFEQLGLPL